MSTQDVAADVKSGHVAMIGSLADDPDRNPIEGSTSSPCRLSLHLALTA